MSSPLAIVEVLFWSCLVAVAFAYLGYPLLILFLARVFGAGPSPQTSTKPLAGRVAPHRRPQRGERHRGPDSQRPGSRLPGGQTRDRDRLGRQYGRDERDRAAVRGPGGQAVRVRDEPRQGDRPERVRPPTARRGGDPVGREHVHGRGRRPAAGGLVRRPGRGRGVRPARPDRSRTGRNIDSLYWKYETFLKKCESRLGALLGSNGAIYAIRKDLFPEVRPGTLIDDFVIPLEAKRRSGCRIVYDTEAVAREETPPTILAEFRRRVRIGAGGFQSIGMLWPLLSPAHGWVAFTFFCHKILRWACPFLLVAMLCANALLIADPFYRSLFGCQLAFYTVAVLGNWLPARPRVLRYFRLPTMFTAMNLALLFGFFRWLRGGQTGVWTRTARSVETVAREPQLHPVGAGE